MKRSTTVFGVGILFSLTVGCSTGNDASQTRSESSSESFSSLSEDEWLQLITDVTKGIGEKNSDEAAGLNLSAFDNFDLSFVADLIETIEIPDPNSNRSFTAGLGTNSSLGQDVINLSCAGPDCPETAFPFDNGLVGQRAEFHAPLGGVIPAPNGLPFSVSVLPAGVTALNADVDLCRIIDRQGVSSVRRCDGGDANASLPSGFYNVQKSNGGAASVFINDRGDYCHIPTPRQLRALASAAPTELPVLAFLGANHVQGGDSAVDGADRCRGGLLPAGWYLGPDRVTRFFTNGEGYRCTYDANRCGALPADIPFYADHDAMIDQGACGC